MSNFIESPRFPETLSYWASGGVEFNTTVVQLNSGFEQRNINWKQSRATYTIQNGLRTQNTSFDDWNITIKYTIDFFRACKGRAFGFRFKDFQDFQISKDEGILEDGRGNGTNTYQLYKNYIKSDLIDAKKITKPVFGTIKIYRNNNLLTFGTDPGNILLDTTTGIVTFIADSIIDIDSISVSTTPIITTKTNHNLSTGNVVLISGINGNTLNNTYNTINVTSPNTFTISRENHVLVTNLGEVSIFPQSSDLLTFEGEFDLACRFDTDQLDYMVTDGGLIQISNLKIVEIRQ